MSFNRMMRVAAIVAVSFAAAFRLVAAEVGTKADDRHAAEVRAKEAEERAKKADAQRAEEERERMRRDHERNRAEIESRMRASREKAYREGRLPAAEVARMKREKGMEAQPPPPSDAGEMAALRREVAALREEIAALRQFLQSQRPPVAAKPAPRKLGQPLSGK